MLYIILACSWFISFFAIEKKETVIAIDTDTILSENKTDLEGIGSFIINANPATGIWESLKICTHIITNLSSIKTKGEEIRKKPGATPTFIATEMIAWLKENNYGNFQEKKNLIIDFLIKPEPMFNAVEVINNFSLNYPIIGWSNYNLYEYMNYKNKLEMKIPYKLHEFIALQRCTYDPQNTNNCIFHNALNHFECINSNPKTFMSDLNPKTLLSLQSIKYLTQQEIPSCKKIIFLSHNEYNIEQWEGKEESITSLLISEKQLKNKQELLDYIKQQLD